MLTPCLSTSSPMPIFGVIGDLFTRLFSLLAAGLLTWLISRLIKNIDHVGSRFLMILFAMVIASHGILDAMTDAGLGVMLLSPFSHERFFLPWRPFYAPPIRMCDLSLYHLQLIIRSETPILLSCSVFAVIFMLLIRQRSIIRN